MNHLNLFYILVLALQFSGKPAPVQPELRPSQVTTVATTTGGREEDAENIPWLFERRLHWDDFHSEPQKQGDAVASTSTSLGISYQVEEGQLSYSITCTFSKQKSWGMLRTDYILAHEQGHFDITEIFARKLYKAMQEYSYNRKSYKQDINNIYKQIVREKEAMQASYDGQSDHSRNRKLQYEWMDKIDHLLLETEPWAQYP